MKIVLIGHMGVGKTTFISALKNLATGFNPVEPLPTISIEKYYIRIGSFEFKVIDTPGHLLLSEKESKKVLKISKKANIILFFVDITRPMTYSLGTIRMLSKYVKPQRTIVIVNKMDLVNYCDAKVIDVIKILKEASFTPASLIPISAKTLYNIYNLLKVIANMLGYDIPIVVPIIAVRVMLNDIIIAEFTQKELPKVLREFLIKATVSKSTELALDLVSAFWSAVKRLLSSVDRTVGENFMIDTLIGKIAIITKNISDDELSGMFVLDKNLALPFGAIKPKLEKFLINVFEYWRVSGTYSIQLTENDVINFLMVN